MLDARGREGLGFRVHGLAEGYTSTPDGANGGGLWRCAKNAGASAEARRAATATLFDAAALTAAALTAVAKGRFEPGRVRGQQVALRLAGPIVFPLDDGA